MIGHIEQDPAGAASPCNHFGPPVAFAFGQHGGVHGVLEPRHQIDEHGDFTDRAFRVIWQGGNLLQTQADMTDRFGAGPAPGGALGCLLPIGGTFPRPARFAEMVGKKFRLIVDRLGEILFQYFTDGPCQVWRVLMSMDS